MAPQKSKTIILVFLIFGQLVVISALAVNIYNKKSKVLGTVSVNPIDKENIIFSPDSQLTNFFEPTPNETLKQAGPAPFEATYTINPDTLNERFEYGVEKPPGTYRIITLGDSFTYGMYVDTKHNWTELLEDKLNSDLTCKNIEKFEVINFGNVGYDLRYSAERFKLRGQKYNTDLVIWFLFDLRRVSDKLISLADKIQQELVESGEIENFVKQGKYYEAWNRAEDEIVSELGEEGVLNYQKEALYELSNYFQKDLLLITLPDSKNYSISTEGRRIIENFTHERPETYYFDDVADVYSLENAVFPQDGHPNKKGHELIANSLFNYLGENNLLPCN